MRSKKRSHQNLATKVESKSTSSNLSETELIAKYRMLQELPSMYNFRKITPSQVELPEEYRRQIEESIQDELADTGFYACIANEAPNAILRLLSQSITGEEFGHARTQAALLSTNPPPLAPPEPVECSGDFVQDVTKARNGEIAAITRYAHLAAEAPTPELRYLFTSILTDEYAHSRAWTAMIQAVTGFEQSSS